MSKSEVFNEIFAVVMAETEVSEAEIIGKCKTIEVVDARYLLVYFLARHAGFTNNAIAKKLAMTPQAVAQILRNFDLRRKQSGRFFEITFVRIAKALESNP